MDIKCIDGMEVKISLLLLQSLVLLIIVMFITIEVQLLNLKYMTTNILE